MMAYMYSHMTTYMHSHMTAYMHSHMTAYMHSHTQILVLTMIGNRIAASVVMTAINTTTPKSCTPVYKWTLLFGMCLT